jgi:hypothetical protein
MRRSPTQSTRIARLASSVPDHSRDKSRPERKRIPIEYEVGPDGRYDERHFQKDFEFSRINTREH